MGWGSGHLELDDHGKVNDMARTHGFFIQVVLLELTFDCFYPRED